MADKPLFITVEGIDGSGKTTQSKFISSYLNACQIDNVWTREPGGTCVAEALRTIILDPGYDIDKQTELMLFMSARCHHLNHKIKPALASNKWVVCDRYMDSTLAYQCESIEHMWETQAWAYDFSWMLMPNITFYMAIDAETAYKRMRDSNKNNGEFGKNVDDRIERQFHDRVDTMITLYEEMNTEYDHYIKINANCPEADVTAQIEEHLQKLF